MMRIDAVIVAAALATAPLGGRAADLVVWWEKGFYAQADEAVAEIIAALKQGTRREVELAFHPQLKLPGKIAAALEAGQPPDFAFGTTVSVYASEWAFDNRLVDLTDTVGHFSDLFDSDAVAWWVLLNQEIGQKALMPCRWAARPTTSTSGRAYWSRRGSPRRHSEGVGRFWSFWCDQVQPAVREALGRDDIWVGLNMSGKFDTQLQVDQFRDAYSANYVTRDGRLVIDDAEVRRRLSQAIDMYTQVHRKGCVPPHSVTWDGRGNNKEFLAQAVVMTLNDTPSIPTH